MILFIIVIVLIVSTNGFVKGLHPGIYTAKNRISTKPRISSTTHHNEIPFWLKTNTFGSSLGVSSTLGVRTLAFTAFLLFGSPNTALAATTEDVKIIEGYKSVSKLLDTWVER